MDNNNLSEKNNLVEKLFKERIIFIEDNITDEIANHINMKLIYLEMEDSTKDIFIYINTNGGSTISGLSICDTIKFLKCDVWVICLGSAFSLGAIILSSGTKGKRICYPNSRIMIHETQSSIGYQKTTDIISRAENIKKLNEMAKGILARNTGKSLKQVLKDCEYDNYMTAEEAKEYGIIDHIIETRNDLEKILFKK